MVSGTAASLRAQLLEAPGAGGCGGDVARAVAVPCWVQSPLQLPFLCQSSGGCGAVVSGWTQ